MSCSKEETYAVVTSGPKAAASVGRSPRAVMSANQKQTAGGGPQNQRYSAQLYPFYNNVYNADCCE